MNFELLLMYQIWIWSFRYRVYYQNEVIITKRQFNNYSLTPNPWMNQRFTSFLKLIFLKRNVFLILALITLGLAFLLYIITEKSPVSATEDKYLYGVQTKIQDVIKASNEDLAKVVTLVSQSKDTTFSHLKIPTTHPYFIFKKGRPIF